MSTNRFFNRNWASRYASAIMIMVGFCSPMLSVIAVTTTDLNKEISGISTNVKKKKAALDALASKAETFRQAILQKKTESATLEDQLALFDNRIAMTQLDIDITKDEVHGLELEMQSLDVKIGSSEDKIVRDRAILGVLARRLYRAQFHKDPIDILLTQNTFSEYFDSIRRVSDLQESVKGVMVQVVAEKAALISDKAQQETKRLAVVERKGALDIAKRELEDERALKDAVLLETKSSELEYRYMLAELKQEQGEADSEIAALEKKLREKMSLVERLKADSSAKLAWPVDPSRGVSTIFHDPDYPFRYVYEHPGLDIRAYQGSVVRSAASGVVARAKNAGMGYSYVMIIHADGVSTVYGHLSKVLAKEDAYVERGEVIAYSGGMPRTPGAGTMTTGPHLHFETRVNGLPVDPMRYLAQF